MHVDSSTDGVIASHAIVMKGEEVVFNYYSYYYSIIIVMKGKEVVFIFAFAISPKRLLFSLY